jgi:putative aldouronate transport system permease protein
MYKSMKQGTGYKIIINAFFILVCLSFVLPMLMVLSISLESEASVRSAGYSLFPREFSLEAYRLAFANPQKMLNAYAVTISQAVIGTLLSCLFAGMVAYPLSRSGFAYKRSVTFIVFFTMLFSGGMIPTYIIYTRLYGMMNSFLAYILPGLAGGAWNTLIFRTFFKGLPESLFESAKIDGAGEIHIFFRIALMLSKPVFATISFIMLVSKWNDWYTSLLYITHQELYTLQYLLQRILNETQFLNSMMANSIPGMNTGVFARPLETYRFALCVLAAGPMLFVFPFFQKYFSKGMVIGAVKG